MAALPAATEPKFLTFGERKVSFFFRRDAVAQSLIVIDAFSGSALAYDKWWLGRASLRTQAPPNGGDGE